MRWGVALLVVLVVLAGCNALGSQPADTPSETVTPVPVPTDTATPEATTPSVAPGLETTGIADVDALVDAHVRAARNTSWVWVERRRVTESRGNVTAVTSDNQTVTYVDERTWHRRAGVVSERTDRVLRFYNDYQQYANGQVLYETWHPVDRGGRVFNRQEASPVGPSFPGFAAAALRSYLPVGSATVSRVDVGDRQHYLVVGSRSTAPGHGTADSYRARAVVREDGFVRRLDVNFTVDAPAVHVEGRYSFGYRRVGNATVEPPDWVDTARSRTEP